jgi:hypothetical protein
MPQKIITPQTPEKLAMIANQIQEASLQVRSVYESLEKLGGRPLGIPNGQILKRACNYIDRFVAGAREAIRDAADEPSDTPPKRQKAGK